MSFFDLKSHSLDGKPVDLSQFKGKVLLVVNTASQCGFTPQYDGLEKLHAELSGKGFAVVGFPSNDFGAQEPGSAAEIQQFCSTKFGVKFPLMQKVTVKGEGTSPVYAFLAKDHGAPKWNFHKYLVGKDGAVLQAFKSGVAPESPELRQAIEQALKS